MAAQRAFLIDGTALAYRAFYAIRRLSTHDGRPTNAIYGVVTILQALLEKERPDYLAVAFDVGKPTFRHQQFAAYKAQRKPMPDPLIQQLPQIKALLAAYRVPVFEQEGYEAEDVLATIARRIVSDQVDVLLVTGDKDALQLVNSHIKVYNPQKDGAIFDAKAVRARYGVEPEQMIDLMALMGDAIDNIPGVPGIGERTAMQLIQRFGTVEQLYAQLGELESSARRKSLEEAREQVAGARELARVHTDVPIDVTLEALTRQEPDWSAVRAMFREFEFRKLLQAIETQAPASDQPACVIHPIHGECDMEALLDQVSRVKDAPVAVVGWPYGDSASGVVAIAWKPGEAWVGRLESSMLQQGTGKRFAVWCTDARARKISHDAKHLKRFFGRLGVTLQGVAGDTMLAAYLLNPARTGQTLRDLVDEYLHQALSPLPALKSTDDIVVSELESAAQQPVAAATCALLPLHEFLVQKLQAAELMALYTSLELPLVDVLADMETVGIAIDREQLASLHASMDAQLAHLTQDIYRIAGGAFNVNSPKQLAQVLFERLGLPIIKRTKTGPSTDSDVLRQLAAQHALPQQLVQYRELSKLVSTYVDALPKLVDPITGRLHTSFNQTATATGRLSSSEPNLQNIPVKTELGRSIRRAFVPGITDGVFMAADYSQIELRILAHLSGDERLVEAFRQGQDIHRVTAALIYGIPESEVQPEQRHAMKAINFGIIYGMTSHGLSKELGISFEEAQTFIDAYFARYPGVRRYLDAQIAQARQSGFVQTLLGRRRYIPEINSSDMMTRQFGERMAVNAPVQGSAADLIKRAMIDVHAALYREGLTSRMVLQVHDELIFEAPRREVQPLISLVRRIMEGAIALAVPLSVTIKTGPNWLDLSPVS